MVLVQGQNKVLCQVILQIKKYDSVASATSLNHLVAIIVLFVSSSTSYFFFFLYIHVEAYYGPS